MVLAILAGLLLTLPSPARGQEEPAVPRNDPAQSRTAPSSEPPGLLAPRALLQARAERLGHRVQDEALSWQARTDSAWELARLEARLREGDFIPGDRILLEGAGGHAPDTVVVTPSGTVEIPGAGSIPLRGVLRSEATERIREGLGQWIVETSSIRAIPLVRISIEGQVRSPGFYDVPADAGLAEALMVAGGLEGDSDPGGLRVERAREVVLEGWRVRDALAERHSLDRIGLEPGDRVLVPARRRLSWSETLRWAFLIGSTLLLGTTALP